MEHCQLILVGACKFRVTVLMQLGGARTKPSLLVDNPISLRCSIVKPGPRLPRSVPLPIPALATH